MLLRAIDDLTENCMLDCGLFYYKELPSLVRLGNNTLLLESLSIGYELTGNPEYLKYGYGTFRKAINEKPGSTNGSKQIITHQRHRDNRQPNDEINHLLQ